MGGNALSTPFNGRVTFASPKATVSGLPNSSSTVLQGGQAVHATIKVGNGGPAAEDLFLDPRLPDTQDLPLLGLVPDRTWRCRCRPTTSRRST